MSIYQTLSGVASNFPKIRGVRWFNLVILLLTPSIAGIGLLTVTIRCQTMWFSALYYVFSMLGEWRSS